ncbi:alpha-L-iduronidase [Spea bombifrons]|uniref:alpha-L-iduronidase n=1 Tax=Spea bombifrons TaxID=233779 RepID=UPI00234A39DC|nr:alpha-L-iduronidase [Spea bombifrons]
MKTNECIITSMETLSLVLVLGLLQGVICKNYVVKVDPTKDRKQMKHFWKSTGFCPPLPHDKSEMYFLGKDQKLNLAYISSVPYNGIVQVRIHWLLDLVTVLVSNGKLQYDFNKLDSFVDLLMMNGLAPGFELMGSPSGYFTDFEDKRQVIEWRNFVFLTATRYIEKYGLQNISKWNFETWNEPDNHDFDNVSMSVKGFQNYYDACSEGLKQASTLLKFGGPGDSCRSPPKSPISWGLLAHCFNGTNFFTGETGVRLDYIALHKKGGGSSLHILEQEIDTVREIHERFPQFKSVPIYNDEADPLVGWSTPQPWRGDVTYAAMITKVIDQHRDYLLSNKSGGFKYHLLSNDNAFMNYYPHYFTQRTLTARFQMNNTKPPHVQMVRKPVLTVMGLLALLGEESVYTDILTEGVETNDSSIVGIMAGSHEPEKGELSDSWETTALLYASNDNRTSSDIQFVTVNFTNFPKLKDLVYVTYYLDNVLTNPYLVWQKTGSPDYPTMKQFELIRDAEDPVIRGPTPFPKDGTLILKLALPVPSVFLIHVCERPKAPPKMVTGLHLISLTKGQVAVVWKDENVKSRCLKTYEVEFSQDGSIFKKINAKDTIFTLFIYSPESATVSGLYRVRAINYWGIPGPYCHPEQFTESF